MKVGFDLDGVVYDFGASVKRYLASIGKPVEFQENRAEPHTWNFFESWGMTPEDFVQVCHDGADAGFIFCGPTRPNAVAAMNDVWNAGHEVIIITDRKFGKTPAVSEKNTYDWLDMHGFAYDSVTFSADKTCVPTDIFVEDKKENFLALWEAGIPCWLITRPWNADLETQYRIDDISEYPAKVEEMANGFILVS